MSSTVTVEQGLSAYFKQPSGPSRPGVDWAVRISGEKAVTVIVRTYFSSTPPQEAEKEDMAARAADFIRRKLAQGWIPAPGLLEFSET